MKIKSSFVLLTSLSFMLSGLIGCSQNDNSKGEDPKDYYGTYSGFSNNSFLDLEINENCVYLRSHIGINSKILSTYYDYDFITDQDYISRTFTEARKKEGLPALYAYASGKEKAIIFWAEKTNDSYTFYAQKNDFVLTKEGVTLSQAMNDPKNYFGTYTYQDNSIELKASGDCVTEINGETEERKYAYVTNDYVKANFSTAKGINDGLPFIATYEEDRVYSEVVYANLYAYDARNKVLRMYLQGKNDYVSFILS